MVSPQMPACPTCKAPLKRRDYPSLGDYLFECNEIFTLEEMRALVAHQKKMATSPLPIEF